MRPIAFAAALAAGTALLASPAVAAAGGGETLFVDPQGNGPLPCDRADPCALEFAVDEASDADRVRVLPGRYELEGTLTIDSAGAVRGVRGRPARLVAGDFIAVHASSSTSPGISDLVVRSRSQGLFAPFSSGVFERLRLVGADDNQATCSVPEAPGVLRDTLCVNRGGGPAVGVGVSALGTYDEDFRLVNVTGVARSGTSAAADGLSASFSTLTSDSVVDNTVIARNSILRGGGAGTDVQGQTSGPGTETLDITLARSNFRATVGAGNTTITQPGSGRNQTATPRFVRPSRNDYRQRESSPTVDAGGNDPVLGAFDFEGDPRELGRRVDIGADELAG
jgi:hypothetical protein